MQELPEVVKWLNGVPHSLGRIQFLFSGELFSIKKIIVIASTNEKRSPEKSVCATPTLKLDDFDGSVVDATKIFPD